MKLSLLITSLSFISSLIAAAAIPDATSHNETLAKRGGEVNYLSNCLRFDVSVANFPPDEYYASYIAWYSDVDATHSGNDRPNSLSSEYRDWSKGGDFLTWEGRQQNIYFPDSGVSVQTHIESDGRSRAFTAYAGWAQRTSDWKVFNCYRDNERQFFTWPPPVPDGTTYAILCKAMYWCV
ncbi:hypothetical protein FRC01_004442 [Tulasnella sp. 417]|nr:hypothetical protein FRC01_004442 [Tulasnella sp. 417]